MALTLAAHPRLILDATTLARIRVEATNNTPLWQDLKSFCDSLMGGTTYLPDGLAYPPGSNSPDVGQGYQGDTYIEAVLNLALGYQILKESDPTTAANYGARAVSVLMAMSEPYPGHGQNPNADDGYGIRNYGVGMGLGYDWLFELLTPTQQTQVYTTANAWVTSFETQTFEYDHPQSNYFAGYLHAKCAITLATYDENPNGNAMWTDWRNNEYGTLVQPYYAINLVGGGWPEGFGNYGPLAVLNMSMPIWEVKTATGEDLTVSTDPFSFLIDTASFLMHFTWPDLSYIDDRDTSHANGNAADPPGTIDPNLFAVAGSSLERYGNSATPVFRAYTNLVQKALQALGGVPYVPSGWPAFLSLQTDTTLNPITDLPLSYIAGGMNQAAARSSWDPSAVWLSMRAGPYVNAPAQGEELTDQGSLAIVKGAYPLLVNTWGWMVHEPNGSADEELLYNDSRGNTSATKNQYVGNSEQFNLFYVRDMEADGVTPNQRFGQGSYARVDGSTTKTVLDDGGTYAYTKSTDIQDQYYPFSGGPAVASWQREIVYLRPNRILVFDNTTAGNLSYDQYMAWHFSADPVVTGVQHAITYSGSYLGTMTPILPASPTVSTIALYPTSTTPKVWQTQVRNSNKSLSDKWLTLFDLAATNSDTTLLTSTSTAVLIHSVDGASAVVFSDALTGATYQQPSMDASHVVTGLTAGNQYGVALSGGNVVIGAGTTFTASSQGLIAFDIAGNTVQSTPAYVPIVPADPTGTLGGGGTGSGGGGTGGIVSTFIPAWSVVGGNTYTTLAEALVEAAIFATASPETKHVVSQPNKVVTFTDGVDIVVTSNNTANPTVAIPTLSGINAANYDILIQYSPAWIVEGVGGFSKEEDAISMASHAALSTPGVGIVVRPPNYGVTYHYAGP